MKRFSKSLKVLSALVGGMVSLMSALVMPVLAQKAATVAPALAKVQDYLIQSTFAQTAPSTISEMSSEVSTMATTIMPGWTMYAIFGLIAALAIWIIARAIRGMKSA